METSDGLSFYILSNATLPKRKFYIFISTIGKSDYINLKIFIQLQVLKKVNNNARRVDIMIKFVVAGGCFICYLLNQTIF